MPDAPAATPALSTTSTSSPALARCRAVDRPWTPAPTTRCLTEAGRVGGTRFAPSRGISVAYNAMALPLRRRSLPPRAAPVSGLADRRPDDDGVRIRPARLGVEPPLEAAGRAHEQVARRGVAAVRERVMAAARGERERAGAGGRQVVDELERQLALE